MTARIEEVDTRTAHEDLLREMHAFYVHADDVVLPGDPPMPYARRAANWREVRSDQAIPRWILRVDGEIVASAVAFMNLRQNLGQAMGWIFVRPSDRGRGHARSLASRLIGHFEERGRTLIDTWVVEGDASAALCERLGLKQAYREQRNRLVMAGVDMSMMRSWIDRAAERAADYDLLELTAPFPDDALDRFCELQFQMNTEPMEEFEREEDEVLEPDIWREQEQRSIASGYELLTYVAVHRPTGEFVGSTTVQADHLQPDQAWQWETVVHPDHRDKGLGRLLKASMIERIVRDWPSVDRIDTYNAASNKPMLGINRAMGFAPIQVTHTYQGDLAAVRAIFDA